MMWPQPPIRIWHLFPFNLTIGQRLFWFMRVVFVYKPTREYYANHQDRAARLRLESSFQGDCPSDQDGPDTGSSSPQAAARCDRGNFCLPKDPRWVKYYTTIWVTIQVYSIIQSGSLILLSSRFLDADRGWNCFVLGRLGLHESFADTIPYLQLLSNLLMLTWRTIILFAFSQYRLDCIVFLSTCRQELEERVSTGFDVHFAQESSSSAAWLRQVLYMEIGQRDGRNLLFLRPNRTMKTYEELTGFFNRFFVVIMAVTASLTVLVAPLIIRTILFDICFVRNYPDCMPDLDQRARAGQLSAWSISWSGYRWLTLPFDVAINLVVWLSDLAGLMIPSMLAILCSQDLVIYWRDLSTKLDELREKMRRQLGPLCSLPRSHMDGTQSISSSIISNGSRVSRGQFLELNNHHHHHHHHHHEDWKPRFNDTVRASHLKSARLVEPPEGSQLELETYILQQQLVDFFRQLWYYNRYVSIIATFFFVAWFSLFMASSYFAASLKSATITTIIRAIQVYGFIAILGPIYALLRVRTSAKRAYPVLASIMAFEQAPARKQCWSQILDYYTHKAAFGFTLLGGYPITWMSYLNLIATSASFLVILDTFWVFKDNNL